MKWKTVIGKLHHNQVLWMIAKQEDVAKIDSSPVWLMMKLNKETFRKALKDAFYLSIQIERYLKKAKCEVDKLYVGDFW